MGSAAVPTLPLEVLSPCNPLTPEKLSASSTALDNLWGVELV